MSCYKPGHHYHGGPGHTAQMKGAEGASFKELLPLERRQDPYSHWQMPQSSRLLVSLGPKQGFVAIQVVT